MMKQKYPDKAPYRHWNLVQIGNETDDLQSQLQAWHNDNPTFAITHHQYRKNGNVEVLSLTFFDIAEAEKDLDEDLRTPRNEFYFNVIADPLVSKESLGTGWYKNRDIDILSKSIDIDLENKLIYTGYIFVDRKESAAAFDKKQENQMKIQQKLANKLAGIKENNIEEDKKE